MRLSTNIFILFVSLGFGGLIGCQNKSDDVDDDDFECLGGSCDSWGTSDSFASNEFVIAQAFTPQGNGGNYAATLGWMAETLQIRILEARQIEENTEKNVKFHLGSMTGGSSGSQVTGIMMNILENKNLIPGAHTDKLFTIAETQIIADALRFMSLTADVEVLEMINTLRQIFYESIAHNPFSNDTVIWWDEQKVDADQVLVDFLTTSLLANTMDLDLLYGKNYSEYDFEQLYTDAMFEGIIPVHLERYSSYEKIPRNARDTDEYLMAFADLKKRTYYLNRDANNYIKSQFRFGAFFFRYLLGAYNAAQPLKHIAERPMEKGFFTITMGVLYEDISDIDSNKAPNYKDIRPIVLGSAETIDAILAQTDYLEDLQDNQNLKKFIFAETENLRCAMALSLREPNIMREFVGEVGSKRIELRSFYDPQIHSTPKRHAFNGQALAVLGGWPDRRISAWLISYYLMDTVETLRSNGYTVKGYMSMFGKPDNRELDKFDTLSIKNLFSSSPEEAAENVAHWFAFQNNYCETFLPRFDDQNIEVETVAFNWDLSNIPAAQSHNSRLLTAMATNATQLQNTHSNGRFVFDSLIEEGYILDYEVIPCTCDNPDL